MDITPTDCRRAALSPMPDYEDALITHAAERQNVDFIIARNKKDFAHSPVPDLTPTEFVGIYKPTCLDYEEIEPAE